MKLVSKSKPTAKFISAKEAAALCGYAPSYVSKLAKNGKIAGKQVKGKWMVDPTSLSEYGASIGKSTVKKSVVSAVPLPAIEQVKCTVTETVHYAQTSPVSMKSLLESLAVAGCSVIIALLMYGAFEAGVEMQDWRAGGSEVVKSLGEGLAVSGAGVTQAAAAITANLPR